MPCTLTVGSVGLNAPSARPAAALPVRHGPRRAAPCTQLGAAQLVAGTSARARRVHTRQCASAHPLEPEQAPEEPASRSPSASAENTPSANLAAPASGATTDSATSYDAPEVAGYKINFQDVYYYVNIAYWTLLLASVITANPFLERITHFENFVTAMFATSTAFVAYYAARWVHDVRGHLASAERRDARGLLRYGFNALFWLGFVLWYCMPTVEWVTDWTATAGAIMCLYGLALAFSAALTVGMWSFMGEAQVPRRLVTGGPYALLRHPQALGNILFLVGFSLAGGAVAASAAFLLSFWIYQRTIIPQEEALLEQKFGDKYRHYVERVPSFAWALVLLLIVEAVLIWRYAPFSLPVGPAMPRPLA